MLIEDSKTFALILLNRDGTPYLRRALDYLKRVEYPGQIVICDSSHPEHAGFVAGSQAAYPDLWIELATFPDTVEFFDKLEATLDRLPAEHAMLCANDDFVIPDVLERCVAALSSDTSLSCARGRSVMFQLVRQPDPGGDSNVGVGLSLYPMRSYMHAGCIERTLEFLRNYSTTMHSVHHRALLLENVRYTGAHSGNLIFFQYLFSAISAVQGRILCLDEPFYIRQGRADSMSAQMRRASYEHWPLLITSPDFSRFYGEFRQAVLDFVAARVGETPPTLPLDFDVAAVGLMRRGFCGKEFDNPEEVKFFERAGANSTRENTLIREITQFAVGYPDTY